MGPTPIPSGDACDSMNHAGELLCGRYRLEDLLGQGGMADVYRATDTESGDAVAVKLVRSSDPGLARRLAQEAKALSSLEHPGLVRLLDAGVHGEQAFLVMELVDGTTLSARLRKGPLSASRTAVLGRTLADALAYVHRKGIVHRDVKPGNVLLGPGPRARLADFGIARLVDESSLTMTGTTLGTAAYMAPEQLEHHAVGTAADVWSLGMILLECLTGKRVFEGTAPEVVARRLAGPVPLPPDLPAPWRLMFEGMLEHDPRQRPSAEQAAGLLSAGPFAEPWQPRALDPDATAAATPVATVPGPVGGSAPADQATSALPRQDRTLVAPGMAPASFATPGAPAPPRPAPPTPTPPGEAGRGQRSRWPWVVGAATVALLAAGGALAGVLASGSSPRHANHAPPPTTTASTTTAPTTTTTLPTVNTTADALAHDINAGVSSGAITSKAGKSLSDELNQALAANQASQQDAAANSVGAMNATIDHEVANGNMTETEANLLRSDVAALAGALGVPNETSPTTSTTVVSGPGNGNGNGNGH